MKVILKYLHKKAGIFLLLLTTIKSNAQEATAQYLTHLNKYLTVTSSDAKINHLFPMVDYWMDVQNDSALKYSKILLQLTRNGQNINEQIRALLNMGKVYHGFGRTDSSEYYYTSTEKLILNSPSTPVEYEFKTYLYLAGIYTIKGKYVLSTGYSIKALKIAETSKNKKWIKSAKVSFAENQAATGNLREAANYYIQALAVNTDETNYEDIKDYIYLSDIYLQLKKPDSSFYYANEGRKLTKKGESFYYYTGLSKAAALMDLKRYAEAISTLNSDYEGAYKLNDNQYLGYSLFIRGSCYLTLKNYKQALKFLTEAIPIAKETGGVDLEIQIYKNLEQYYIDNNQYREAYSYGKKATLLSDSIHTIEKEKQIANLSSKFELEKNQVELKENQAELSFNRDLLIISVGAIIIFVLLLVLLYISNRKRKILNHELAELNNKKDRLFNVMSHDLRSPLADLYHQLHIETNKLPPDYDRTGLTHTEERLATTLNMLDNLLYWSVGQIQGLSRNAVAFYLINAVDDAIAINRRALDSRNIELINDVDTEIMVYADQQMVTTVIRNLIQNAVKFSNDEGVIRIYSKEISSNTLQLYIKDNGVGIQESNLQHIFEGGKSTIGTKGERGTGVGLNLCKTFVELNDGKIYAESKIGEGTCIYFDIPIAV